MNRNIKQKQNVYSRKLESRPVDYSKAITAVEKNRSKLTIDPKQKSHLKYL